MLILEWLCCRPRSATACAWPRAVWYELQNDLRLVAVRVRLGDAWERLSGEMRSAAISVKVQAA